MELPSNEGKVKMVHMSKMFQMYSTHEFTANCDVWVSGVCRYLNDVYAPIAASILSLMTDVCLWYFIRHCISVNYSYDAPSEGYMARPTARPTARINNLFHVTGHRDACCAHWLSPVYK